MPRKGKLERAQSSSAQGPSAANKYGRWRSVVRDLLITKWQNSEDVDSVAATVVGMFDAGASDVEVAAFLESQEESADEQSLTDEARMALVREIHRSAGSAGSTQPSDEES